ncbi:MAG: hypothetical protein AAGF53_18665 [Pseudomonadota bacterium]
MISFANNNFPLQRHKTLDKPTIASLWLGPRLTFLEQVCLKSFYDHGHRVILYAYDQIENAPNGIEVQNASPILRNDEQIVNKQSGSPAAIADKFRYHMLKQTDYVWVDTDACCIKPFPSQPYFFARYFNYSVNNSVLRLPKDSPTLERLLEFTSTSNYTDLPPGMYNSPPSRRLIQERQRKGETVHVSELDHETWGPLALTHFLLETGEYRETMKDDVLNPLSAARIGKTVRPKAKVQLELPECCLSVHFYGTHIRRVLRALGGLPAETSFLSELCLQHGIDPKQAPIV